MLITIEGLPYSGKKTQQRMLAEVFKRWDFNPVVETNEPGWKKDPISAMIKHLAQSENTSSREKLFLFLADRAGHYERFVRQIYGHASKGYLDHNGAPANNPAFICAGGPDSTLVYQGFVGNLAPLPFLVQANDVAMQDIKINATIILDIEIEEMMNRIPSIHKKKYENNVESFVKAQRGFRGIADLEPERTTLIDANGSPESVHEKILEALKQKLAPKG